MLILVIFAEWSKMTTFATLADPCCPCQMKPTQTFWEAPDAIRFRMLLSSVRDTPTTSHTTEIFSMKSDHKWSRIVRRDMLSRWSILMETRQVISHNLQRHAIQMKHSYRPASLIKNECTSQDQMLHANGILMHADRQCDAMLYAHFLSTGMSVCNCTPAWAVHHWGIS